MLERVGIAAAGTRHGGPTAAAAAHDRRHLADHVDRRQARDRRRSGRSSRPGAPGRPGSMPSTITAGASRALSRSDACSSESESASRTEAAITRTPPCSTAVSASSASALPLVSAADAGDRCLIRLISFVALGDEPRPPRSSSADRSAQVLDGGGAGDRLDPADALRRAGLASQHEGADLGRRAHVGAAAQLAGDARDLHHPHVLAVLLSEQHRGAQLAGVILAGDEDVQRMVLHDPLVHDPLDLASPARRSSGCPWRKSKRSLSGPTYEPAWVTCSPRTSRSARCSRCVAV